MLPGRFAYYGYQSAVGTTGGGSCGHWWAAGSVGPLLAMCSGTSGMQWAMDSCSGQVGDGKASIGRGQQRGPAWGSWGQGTGAVAGRSYYRGQRVAEGFTGGSSEQRAAYRLSPSAFGLQASASPCGIVPWPESAHACANGMPSSCGSTQLGNGR